MSEIINYKFINYAKMNDIPGAHDGTNAVVQAIVDNNPNVWYKLELITTPMLWYKLELTTTPMCIVQTGVDNCITLNECKVEERTKTISNS